MRRGNFLDRMERKYGKYAINDLMKYIMIIYVAGFIFSIVDKGGVVYAKYMSLDLNMLLKGQVWRLVTFLFRPETVYDESNPLLTIFFFMIFVSVYLMIGRQLENAWGAFRFNMYYFSGILFTIIGSLLAQSVFKYIGAYNPSIFGGETKYLGETMFLAFATVFPDVQFLFMFIIPVKVKWLGMFYGAYICYDFGIGVFTGIKALTEGNSVMSLYYFAGAVMLLFAMINFLIYFISVRKNVNRGGISRIQKRKNKSSRSAIAKAMSGSRHKCSICGKTEKDDENLEFRYCSRCEGNHEYCMEHLFTHEHVKKFVIDINKDIKKQKNKSSEENEE